MIKNLKKVISTVAAVATLASSASALAVSFPDVDEAASYAGAVEALVALDIVNGDENGKFNPDNSVTRAEFAKMVVEALGAGSAAASSNYTKFADAKGHWAAGYIETGVAKSFINGYDENTFGPDDTVTYAQGVKMLVGACGYDLWAQTQGGWPSGYLAFGSSLNIVNGVAGTVGNDTALTRAQCAVLIYNALKAPILAVNGYDYDNLGNLVPKYEPKDGKKDRDWGSMLTEYHDAYVAKGRVNATSKTDSGLDADEVAFKVELSDNFNGEKVKDDTDNAVDPYQETMYVGTTDAANLLFTYSEAIIQKDDNTDEYTLISLVPYGANKTVEFSADLIRAVVASESIDDGRNAADPFYNSSTNRKPAIAVAKSETTNNTTKYELALTKDADGNVTGDAVELYVNGKNVTWDAANFAQYLYENNTATVTLVDATNEGSTSTDGKYDYIMVDYYASAVIDSVSVSNSKVKLYFDNATNNAGSLSYDPENEDVFVSITKGGVEINPEDLVEGDVISVAYDVDNYAGSEYYEIIVSENAPVTGTLKSYDQDDNSIKLDDADYVVDKRYIADVSSYATRLSDEFVAYLDVFGNVVYLEDGTSSKNYGIIVGAYKSNSYDYPVVRMITTDGEVKLIEAKDNAVATSIETIINGAKAAGNSDTFAFAANNSFSKADLVDDAATTSVNEKKYEIAKLVVDYKLSGGKLSQATALTAANASAPSVEYKESSSKLASYAISDAATKILVVEDYLNGGSEVATIETSALEDEVFYNALVYAKNTNTGDYQFVLLLSGLSSVRQNGAWGVVKSVSRTTVDDEPCWTMTVANGKDDVEVSVSTSVQATQPYEGDVVAYSVGTKGYIDNSAYFYIVASVAGEAATAGKALYSELYGYWTANDLVNSTYKSTVFPSGQTDPKTEIVFAPVYKKVNNNLEVIKTVPTAGVSNVNTDIESYTVGSEANVYVYNYNNSAKNKVESSLVPNQKSNIFKDALSGTENEIITWATADTAGVRPNYALIKVYEGDVTDVVIFTAE